MFVFVSRADGLSCTPGCLPMKKEIIAAMTRGMWLASLLHVVCTLVKWGKVSLCLLQFQQSAQKKLAACSTILCSEGFGQFCKPGSSTRQFCLDTALHFCHIFHSFYLVHLLFSTGKRLLQGWN
jgi:hypothetical protein